MDFTRSLASLTITPFANTISMVAGVLVKQLSPLKDVLTTDLCRQNLDCDGVRTSA